MSLSFQEMVEELRVNLGDFLDLDIIKMGLRMKTGRLMDQNRVSLSVLLWTVVNIVYVIYYKYTMVYSIVYIIYYSILIYHSILYTISIDILQYILYTLSIDIFIVYIIYYSVIYTIFPTGIIILWNYVVLKICGALKMVTKSYRCSHKE